MTSFQAVLLGIVQGITEFLPISSTAHLILVPWAAGWQVDEEARFVFDVLLQWGTVFAVMVYFWRDLLRIARAVIGGLRIRRALDSPDARLGWWIMVGTVPAVALGILCKRFFVGLHGNPRAVAAIVLGASALIFVSEKAGRRTRSIASLGWGDALFIGAAQSLALVPGVSRSAATICGGLLCNLERPAAARFSFLLSIPVLLGAGLLALKELLALPGYAAYLPPLLAGTAASMLVGLMAIHWLMGYLNRHPLTAFAWYRIVAGAGFLALSFVRGG